MRKLCKLPEQHRLAVMRVIGEYVLTHGKRTPESLAEFIPLWKKYGLYEQCIPINKKIVNVGAVKNELIREAIAKAGLPPTIPCSRDFLEGMIMASGELTRGKKGKYKSYEFIGAQQSAHVTSFLAACGAKFVAFKPPRDRHLVRTNSLLFMTVEPEGDMEQQLAGMIAGGTPKYADGNFYISMKPCCAKLLNTMGMHYDVRKSGGGKPRLFLSAFYLPLYISDMPPHFFDFWMQHMPIGNSRKTHGAALTAIMHWRLLFGNVPRVPGALPYLLDREQAAGIARIDDAMKIVEERKIDLVDSRLVTRMKNWMLIHLGEEKASKFFTSNNE